MRWNVAADVPGRHSDSNWQSFADLAMGLVAVLALTLVVMLQQKQEDYDKLQDQAQELTEDRKQFAVSLLALLRRLEGIVSAQDDAEAWLSAQFREGQCRLELAADGRLTVRGSGGKRADLYDSGETRLNAAGQDALASCRDNFLRLAFALSTRREQPRAREARCAKAWQAYEATLAVEDTRRAVSNLRDGLEALVLEGNTDRVGPGWRVAGRGIPPIAGKRWALRLGASANSFAQNALLGAERARQALGHLLHLVEACDADEYDALEVLMSRVRIESPAFGRYLAGPRDRRRVGCDPKHPACSAARNLSLRVRWRKEELRRPYFEFKERFCDLLSHEGSSLARGLGAAGLDVQALETQHCKGRM